LLFGLAGHRAHGHHLYQRRVEESIKEVGFHILPIRRARVQGF
jgi:hypothetical protein